MVVGNEDIIDEEGRKKIYTGHTVKIWVCAKPRLVPSGHLAYHNVVRPEIY